MEEATGGDKQGVSRSGCWENGHRWKEGLQPGDWMVARMRLVTMETMGLGQDSGHALERGLLGL